MPGRPADRPLARRLAAGCAVLAATALAACSSGSSGTPAASTAPTASTALSPSVPPASETTSGAAASGVNVYAHAGAGMLTAVTRHAKPLVYVPNLGRNSVSVIDGLKAAVGFWM